MAEWQTHLTQNQAFSERVGSSPTLGTKQYQGLPGFGKFFVLWFFRSLLEIVGSKKPPTEGRLLTVYNRVKVFWATFGRCRFTARTLLSRPLWPLPSASEWQGRGEYSPPIGLR